MAQTWSESSIGVAGGQIELRQILPQQLLPGHALASGKVTEGTAYLDTELVSAVWKEA